MAQLIGREEYGPARVRARRYLNLYPEDGRAVFLFGLTYHKERKYGAARPHFVKALELAPDYAPIHHFLAYCNFNLGDLDGARRHFEQHIAATPNEADSHYGLGLVELEEGNLDAAEQRFRDSIRLNLALRETNPQRFQGRQSDIAKGHAMLADVHAARQEYEAARAELERSIEIYPGHYSVYYTLSQICRRLGDDTCADETHRTYCFSLLRVGQLREARREFELRLHNNAEEHDAHFGLALIDRQERDYPAAIEHLTEAIVLIGHDTERPDVLAQYLRLRGENRALDGKMQLARDDLLKSLDVHPQPITCARLAVIYRQLGDDDAAQEMLRRQAELSTPPASQPDAPSSDPGSPTP